LTILGQYSVFFFSAEAAAVFAILLISSLVFLDQTV
jgi:hypothetical protein